MDACMVYVAEHQDLDPELYCRRLWSASVSEDERKKKREDLEREMKCQIILLGLRLLGEFLLRTARSLNRVTTT